MRELVKRPDAVEVERADGAVLIVNRATGARFEVTECEVRLYDSAGNCVELAGDAADILSELNRFLDGSARA